MANRQWSNLLILIVVYLVVRQVSSYFEKLTAPPTDTGTGTGTWGLANNFVHYALLGYFSAKYWILIIALAVATNLWKFARNGFNVVDFIKNGMVQVISAKVVGLLAGIILSHVFPMKISLWGIVKEIFF